MRLLFIILLSIWLFPAFSQGLSPEMRDKFVADQDAYFKELNLHENQKRNYEEITRRYDKRVIKVEQSNWSKAKKNKEIKALDRSKNNEMKVLLTTYQYKLYLKRQKEILTKYN